MRIETDGRTDIADFFEKSGIRETKKEVHTPYLVFLKTKQGVKVEIVQKIKELIEYPSQTKVMAQWGG